MAGHSAEPGAAADTGAREYAGILHDPVAGVATRCRVVVDPGGLEVRGAEMRRKVPLGNLECSTGGWDGGTVHFAWEEGGKRWALSFNDPGIVRDNAGVFPAGFVREAQASQRQARRSGRRAAVFYALWAASFVLPFALLAVGWTKRGALIDWALPRVPAAVDVEVGRATALSMGLTESTKVSASSGSADSKLVFAVVQRLLGPEPRRGGFTFEVHLSMSAEINAFALPGGVIAVNSGFLGFARGPEELAGVLAHEIAHVTERHGMRQMIFAAGFSGLLSLAVGSLPTASWAAEELGGLRFSREQELAADREGLAILREAKISPKGMIDFFSRMSEQGKAVPAFLSTHPADAERIEAIRAGIARLGVWEELAL